MTSQLPRVLTGDVVPGSIIGPKVEYPFLQSLPSRVQRSFVTSTPFGPPIKKPEVKSVPIPPRPTGDDKNQQMLKILQSVMQKQGGDKKVSEPIAQSLPGNRSWQG